MKRDAVPLVGTVELLSRGLEICGCDESVENLLQGNLEDSQLLGQKRPGFSRLGFNLLMTARDSEPVGKALSTWY